MHSGGRELGPYLPAAHSPLLPLCTLPQNGKAKSVGPAGTLGLRVMPQWVDRESLLQKLVQKLSVEASAPPGLSTLSFVDLQRKTLESEVYPLLGLEPRRMQIA